VPFKSSESAKNHFNFPNLSNPFNFVIGLYEISGAVYALLLVQMMLLK